MRIMLSILTLALLSFFSTCEIQAAQPAKSLKRKKPCSGASASSKSEVPAHKLPREARTYPIYARPTLHQAAPDLKGQHTLHCGYYALNACVCAHNWEFISDTFDTESREHMKENFRSHRCPAWEKQICQHRTQDPCTHETHASSAINNVRSHELEYLIAQLPKQMRENTIVFDSTTLIDNILARKIWREELYSRIKRLRQKNSVPQAILVNTGRESGALSLRDNLSRTTHWVLFFLQKMPDGTIYMFHYDSLNPTACYQNTRFDHSNMYVKKLYDLFVYADIEALHSFALQLKNNFERIGGYTQQMNETSLRYFNQLKDRVRQAFAKLQEIAWTKSTPGKLQQKQRGDNEEETELESINIFEDGWVFDQQETMLALTYNNGSKHHRDQLQEYERWIFNAFPCLKPLQEELAGKIAYSLDKDALRTHTIILLQELFAQTVSTGILTLGKFIEIAYQNNIFLVGEHSFLFDALT